MNKCGVFVHKLAVKTYSITYGYPQILNDIYGMIAAQQIIPLYLIHKFRVPQ